jgi:hypothetical protein
MKPFVLTFACAATLTAQNFIQMSDPQFGMFTKDASFEHETVNFEFAIAIANHRKPAFDHQRPHQQGRQPGAGSRVQADLRETRSEDPSLQRPRQFSYTGVFVLLLTIPILLAIGLFFQCREKAEERDFIKKYGKKHDNAEQLAQPDASSLPR